MNAVLRRCLRNMDDQQQYEGPGRADALLPALSPDQKRKDMVHSLGVRFSHPDWIVVSVHHAMIKPLSSVDAGRWVLRHS